MNNNVSPSITAALYKRDENSPEVEPMMVSSVYKTIQYYASHDSLLDTNYYFIRQREFGAGGRGGVWIDG